MQVITQNTPDKTLRPSGYLIHKHDFRVSYLFSFFYVGFVCKSCDEIVVIGRDVWYSWLNPDKE